jgi:hypothetical protein
MMFTDELGIGVIEAQLIRVTRRLRAAIDQ